MSSSSMRMTPKRGYVGLCGVIGMMLLTIYMAFAFPFTLFQLKQTETTEIKSVIIIGRTGEKSPSPESYFMGEEPPEELNMLGYEQLTNVGKERMYLLGKFLKLRYYQLLLNGSPRMLKVRSADLDRTLESTQALLAGLNPPKEGWLWSSGASDLKDWQPKAVHTTSASSDDLLSISPNCYRLNQDRMKWKNSTRYMQLVNEFRHDLQTLRANTGLEFEDDLEMLIEIEDSLKTRLAYKADVPAWYTPTFANRLSHIADVTTGSRYSSADIQRLYVGRLLDEIVENVNSRIRLDQELMAAAQGREASSSPPVNEMVDFQPVRSQSSTRTKCILEEPKVYIYMTDKQRLAALMNSLQIYTSQPQFGSLLLIELHHDPINHLYFLRLFTISSTSPNVFPEPLRVNPIACADSTECSPQQFDQNIRHLMLDRSGWQEACNAPPSSNEHGSTQSNDLQPQSQVPTKGGNKHQSSSTTTTTTTSSTTQLPSILTDLNPSIADGSSTISSVEKLDESLLVGPTSVQTEASAERQTNNFTTMSSSTMSIPLLPDTSNLENLSGQQQQQQGKHVLDSTLSKQESSNLISELPKLIRDPREDFETQGGLIIDSSKPSRDYRPPTNSIVPESQL